MRGVVVCPQPLAAEAGAAVLDAGGNAFDAAIAAAFVQMVTDPHMCGLGGFGCATYRTPSEIWHAGFHARVGSRATPEMWAGESTGRLALGGYSSFEDHRSNLGHRAVGTPGVVAGLAALHQHARLGWGDLLGPAVELAREGFTAPDYLFDMLPRLSGPGLPSPYIRMTCTPDSAELWCRTDGTLKQPGDNWSNPRLAQTLELLAQEGPHAFYQGDLAQAIASELARGGGYVTLDDLQRYRVRVTAPVEGSFRGLRVYSSTPPTSGVTLIQMLRLLERLAPDLSQETPRVLAFAAVMREAFAERARSMGDPEFTRIEVSALLSDAWLDEAEARIRAGGPLHESSQVPVQGTTHLSTYDVEGNAVALTHTLGLYSGVIVPGTGIALNSGMDLVDPEPGHINSIAPGKARVGGMAPTIALGTDGEVIVSGSPGTNAIVTSVLQVLVATLALGLSPLDAVSLPRVHCEGGPVFAEGRISQRSVAALRAAGFEVRTFTANYAPATGRNQLIVARGEIMRAASDPRRDGGVAAYNLA